MRYILYNATQRKIKPRQADFVTAYLNSKTTDLARALIDEPSGFVIKLKKTLYGLKQAARGWYTTMTDWFIRHGYRISDADPCLFISDQGDLAFAWVDDLILGDKKMFINQTHYIKNLVEEYGLEDGKVTGTPMQSNIKLVKCSRKAVAIS